MAVREISLGRDLAPGDAPIAMVHADVQIALGRTAAGTAAAGQAVALDPPTSGTYVAWAGTYMSARRYDDAEMAARRARSWATIEARAAWKA